MIRLYYAPRTRAVRVRWLLEELGLAYELVRVDFQVPSGGFFAQATPSGKVPVIEDDGVVISESGAILEYIVDRYGAARLARSVDSAARGLYLQWLHFAEGTASVPLSTILWHTLYKGDADQVPTRSDPGCRCARSCPLDAHGDRARAGRERLSPGL